MSNQPQDSQTTVVRAADPVLKLRFLSHGTLESKNLDRSKQFYTEFLGLEVIRTSPFSLLIRLGGNHTIAVVEQKRSSDVMSLFNHNGLDVETQAEVDECHRIAIENAAKWDLKKIGKPSIQHGTYSFSSGIWMATAGKF